MPHSLVAHSLLKAWWWQSHEFQKVGTLYAGQYLRNHVFKRSRNNWTRLNIAEGLFKCGSSLAKAIVKAGTRLALNSFNYGLPRLDQIWLNACWSLTQCFLRSRSIIAEGLLKSSANPADAMLKTGSRVAYYSFNYGPRINQDLLKACS